MASWRAWRRAGWARLCSVSETMSVEGLLSGAGEVLDRLRLREKELEESLALVRERLTAGEAVLAAVSRWRSLSALSPLPDLSPVVAASPVDVPAVGRPGLEESLVGRIELLLGQDPSRVWKAAQVREVLGASASGVHTAMSRLAERGRLVRVSSGRYRAADAVRAC